MGWGRRKLDNAAAGTLPPIRPPINTTIHNHGVSWPLVIVAGFVCFLLSLPILWWILVYLFTTMGGSEKEAAFWVVIIPVLFLIGWCLKIIIVAFLDRFYGYRLEVQKELTRREELRLLAAQTAIEPGRYTEDDYQFARVVLSVMSNAYTWLADKKLDRFPARWRPWSRAEALETAEKIGVTITHTQALNIAKELAKEGIITAADMGQISKDYPTLSSVKAHLDNKYGRPIMVIAPTLRDNRGFRFTE